jgi:hypothetical protein
MSEMKPSKTPILKVIVLQIFLCESELSFSFSFEKTWRDLYFESHKIKFGIFPPIQITNCGHAKHAPIQSDNDRFECGFVPMCLSVT